MLIEIFSCVWKQFSITILETLFWNLVKQIMVRRRFQECMFAPATIAPRINANIKRNPNPNPNPNLTPPQTQNPIITLTLTLCCRRYHHRSNCRRSKCRTINFKSSFARFWVCVGHLSDLTSQLLLRMQSSAWPCFRFRSGMHRRAFVIDRPMKLPDSCSGKHVCTCVVCAEPLINVWKVRNSKRFCETLFTNAITNEIFLPSENALSWVLIFS